MLLLPYRLTSGRRWIFQDPDLKNRREQAKMQGAAQRTTKHTVLVGEE